MKNLTIYFFILLFAIAIGKPIYPILGYWMNKDFIVQNLCVEKEEVVNDCQGNCHLKVEVSKSQEENKSDKNTLKLSKVELEFYYSINNRWKINGFVSMSELDVYSSFYKDFSQQFFLFSCFQPPEFA